MRDPRFENPSLEYTGKNIAAARDILISNTLTLDVLVMKAPKHKITAE